MKVDRYEGNEREDREIPDASPSILGKSWCPEVEINDLSFRHL